jgi:hypothetical protein
VDSVISPLQQAQIAHSEAAERCHTAILALTQAQAEMEAASKAERKAICRVVNLRAVKPGDEHFPEGDQK